MYHSIRYMSKKIPITNLHYFTEWSAMQSENSSIRFDFSSKIHSARAALTAWQNRSERCWKMHDLRPSNAWTHFALGDLGGISSPPKIITVYTFLTLKMEPNAWKGFFRSYVLGQWYCYIFNMILKNNNQDLNWYWNALWLSSHSFWKLHNCIQALK